MIMTYEKYVVFSKYIPKKGMNFKNHTLKKKIIYVFQYLATFNADLRGIEYPPQLDTHAERKKHSTFFIINKIEPVTEIRQLDLYSNKPFYTVYIFT